MNATRDAVGLNSVAVQDLFQWVEKGGRSWSDYGRMAKDAWDVLRGLSFSDIRAGLNSIAEGAGLSVGQLGLMGTAGAVMGAGYAGWGVGRAIADFFKLDQAIGNATAKLIGWGDVGGQTAAAKQDTINAAINRGAAATVTYTDAIKFNTQWMKNQQEAAVALNDIFARQHAPEEFAKQMASWQAEIKSVVDAGSLDALKAGIQSHIISVKELSASYRISEGAVNLYKQQLDKEEAAHRASESAARKHREEQDRLAAQIAKTGAELDRWSANVVANAMNADRMTINLKGLGAALPITDFQKATDAVAKWEHEAAIGTDTTFELMKNLKGLGLETLPQLTTKTKQSVDVLKELDTILAGVHNKFVEVAEIGIRAAESINKITSAASESGEALTKGDWLKIAVIGITAVASAIGKLFGINEEKKINPIREEFVQINGGLAELNEKAHAAGATLDAMLNAKNPEQYKKAIDDLNAALQFQDSAMKTLDDTVQKYGFTIEELGPKFSQQKLSEGFLQLYQDTKVLTAAGIDYDTIIGKQAESYEKLVLSAMKSGATIPMELQPVLQRMVDLGLLTDASGEKLTDLGQLTFAETLDAKFTTLIDTIQKLADAISRGLNTAINSIPNEKIIHVGYEYEPYNPPSQDTAYAWRGGEVTNAGVQYLAGGGRVLPFRRSGSDTVPAMLTPGEGVVNRAGMKRLGRSGLSALNAGGGGGGLTLNIGDISVGDNVSDAELEDKIGKAIGRAIRRKGKRIA